MQPTIVEGDGTVTSVNALMDIHATHSEVKAVFFAPCGHPQREQCNLLLASVAVTVIVAPCERALNSNALWCIHIGLLQDWDWDWDRNRAQEEWVVWF